MDKKKQIKAKKTEEGLGQTISKSWLDFNDIFQAMDFLIAKESKVMGETLTLGGV